MCRRKSVWEIKYPSKRSGKEKWFGIQVARTAKDNLIGLPQSHNVHHSKIYIFSATNRKYFKSFFYIIRKLSFEFLNFFCFFFATLLMFLYIFYLVDRRRRQKDINKLLIINLNWELIFHFHFFSLEKSDKKLKISENLPLDSANAISTYLNMMHFEVSWTFISSTNLNFFLTTARVYFTETKSFFPLVNRWMYKSKLKCFLLKGRL